MERSHAWSGLRTVDQNPVRAGLVAQASEWRWSSAQAHSRKVLDEFGLLDDEWIGWRDWPDWNEFLQLTDRDEDERLRAHTKNSRPLGAEAFVRRCEEAAGYRLSALPNGRPSKQAHRTVVMTG